MDETAVNPCVTCVSAIHRRQTIYKRLFLSRVSCSFVRKTRGTFGKRARHTVLYSFFLVNKDTLHAAAGKGSLPLHLSGTHGISCYITSPLYCSLLQRRGLIALINNTDIDSREATRFLLKTSDMKPHTVFRKQHKLTP